MAHVYVCICIVCIFRPWLFNHVVCGYVCMYVFFLFFSFHFLFRFGLFTFVALGNRGSPHEVISVTCESSWLSRHTIIYINYIYIFFTYIFSLYIYGRVLWSKYIFQFQFPLNDITKSNVFIFDSCFVLFFNYTRRCIDILQIFVWISVANLHC